MYNCSSVLGSYTVPPTLESHHSSTQLPLICLFVGDVSRRKQIKFCVCMYLLTSLRQFIIVVNYIGYVVVYIPH